VKLADAVRAALAAQADAAKAGPMQAYMKSSMPFLGMAAPLRRQVVKQAAVGLLCSDTPTLSQAVLALWEPARFREERYAALDLLRLSPHRRLISLGLLPAVETMLRTGPWWDFNDEISGQVLPLLLLHHPAEMKPLLRQWARSDDLWFRRAAMLAQRALKQDFDAVLFYDCILPSLGDPRFEREFFINKGMGWALRERSYAAPKEVQAFCTEYAAQLSPLTVREGLRVVRRHLDQASRRGIGLAGPLADGPRGG
jgi:3-methyladenine DNA glycosylase AlkD